jgi:hypothetical protein
MSWRFGKSIRWRYQTSLKLWKTPPIGSDTSAWNYRSTLTLDVGSDRLPEMLIYYHSTLLKSQMIADLVYIAAEA